MRLPLAAFLAMLATTTCGGGEAQPLPTAPSSAALIDVMAPRFTNGSIVAPRYTCDGVNLSPDLSWTGVPQEAESLVVVLDDPDAPGGQFIHWLVYDLPPDTTDLVEGAGNPFETLPEGGLQTENDFGDLGYSGPCPPSGETHTYRLHVYALDRELSGLPDSATRDDVLLEMEGAIMGHGTFETEYSRIVRSDENVVFKRTPTP